MLPGVAGVPETVNAIPPMELLRMVDKLVGEEPPKMIPQKIKAEPLAVTTMLLLTAKLPMVLLIQLKAPCPKIKPPLKPVPLEVVRLIF